LEIGIPGDQARRRAEQRAASGLSRPRRAVDSQGTAQFCHGAVRERMAHAGPFLGLIDSMTGENAGALTWDFSWVEGGGGGGGGTRRRRRRRRKERSRRRESNTRSQLGKGGWPYDAELERMIMAGHRVMHTPSNGHERRRPRDIRGMCEIPRCARQHEPLICCINGRDPSLRQTSKGLAS